MKRILLLSSLALLAIASNAQFKNVVRKDSSGKTGIDKIVQRATGKTNLSNDEIAGGLKEALNVGTDNASKKLSTTDGFLKKLLSKF